MTTRSVRGIPWLFIAFLLASTAWPLAAAAQQFPNGGIDNYDGVIVQFNLISGLGTDFISITSGTDALTVKRLDPVSGGVTTIAGDITLVELTGTGAAHGTVKIRITGTPQSAGTISGRSAPPNDFPADVFFNTFIEIDLPDQGEIGLNNTSLIRLRNVSTSPVTAVPILNTTIEGLVGNARVLDVAGGGASTRSIRDLQIQFPAIIDCNNNSTNDATDIATSFSEDCDGNNIPDECDIAIGIVEDCQPNGVPDLCDISLGTSTDTNTNNIPDECECSIPADCDDGDACTADTCPAGLCAHTNSTPAGQCCDSITGSLTPIDDVDPCTDDTCNADGTVTHAPTGSINVTLQAQAIGTAVTRNVTFLITECGQPVDARVVPIAFDATGAGSTILNGIDAGAGWLATTEGHTLTRRTALSFTACAATATITGGSTLVAGDFQTATIAQDNIVDITDFSILAGNFATPIDPTLSTGGDATGDGSQGTGDFTAIQINFFQVGDVDDGCGGGSGEGGDQFQGKVSVSVSDLDMPAAHRADLNGDGVVDVKDIRAFALRYHLIDGPGVRQWLDALDAKITSASLRNNREQ